MRDRERAREGARKRAGEGEGERVRQREREKGRRQKKMEGERENEQARACVQKGERAREKEGWEAGTCQLRLKRKVLFLEFFTQNCVFVARSGNERL